MTIVQASQHIGAGVVYQPAHGPREVSADGTALAQIRDWVLALHEAVRRALAAVASVVRRIARALRIKPPTPSPAAVYRERRAHRAALRRRVRDRARQHRALPEEAS